MINTDLFVLRHSENQLYIEDRYSKNNSKPILDRKNNYELVSGGKGT